MKLRVVMARRGVAEMATVMFSGGAEQSYEGIGKKNGKGSIRLKDRLLWLPAR